MRWKAGDQITGDVARLELPDGTQLQHVQPAPFDAEGQDRGKTP